jgi:hypothetical protein
VLLLLISIGFFVKAHYESGYEKKQNQTVYYTSTMPILIRRVGQLMMLIWILGPIFRRKPETCYNFESNSVVQQIQFGFTYVAPAPKKNSKPTVEFLKTVLLEIKILKT